MLPERAAPLPLTVATRRDPPPLASHGGDRQASIVREWEGINHRLSAVIGAGGMGALYHRALFLAATTHALLLPALGEPGQELDLSALAAALAGHPDAEVSAAGDALMQTFVQVLASLIGTALAEQLLHPLLAPGAPASAKPEPSP